MCRWHLFSNMTLFSSIKSSYRDLIIITLATIFMNICTARYSFQNTPSYFLMPSSQPLPKMVLFIDQEIGLREMN